jgi:uncharacterized beta-barrel protein YwiB (DUF1934 family)
MLKKIRIEITTVRYEVPGSFYGAIGEQPTPVLDASPASPADVERTVLVTDASYHDDGHRVCIRYTENAESGMEGTRTAVAFQKCEPALVSVLRDGAVKSALHLKEGERYFGVYQTPIMPFELCVLPRLVENGMEKTGILRLDYTLELKGAQAQRTMLTLRVL